MTSQWHHHHHHSHSTVLMQDNKAAWWSHPWPVMSVSTTPRDEGLGDALISRIILCMCPANERWHYNVMPSLIGWAHTYTEWSLKWGTGWCLYFRDHSVYAPSQWEMALQCNTISHLLGTYIHRMIPVLYRMGESHKKSLTAIILQKLCVFWPRSHFSSSTKV